MTSPGHVRTAAARQARTQKKHQRWAEELRGAGWLVAAHAEAFVFKAGTEEERWMHPSDVTVVVP